jgi:hypothetical protein
VHLATARDRPTKIVSDIQASAALTAVAVMFHFGTRRSVRTILYTKRPTPTANTEPKWPTCFIFQALNIQTMPMKPIV